MMMMLFPKPPNRGFRRARQSRGAHFCNCVCLAAVRALTGSDLYEQGEMTREQAAISVGSNLRYIIAAGWLIKARDMRLIERVVYGHVPILTAAEWVKPQVMAIEALKNASPAAKAAIYAQTGFTNDLAKLLVDKSSTERTEAAAKLGVIKVWDDMVCPLTK